MTIKSIRDIDPEKLAAAIEADAGQAMPGLRESIREAQQGIYGKVYTPEMLQEIKRKRQAAYEERRIKKGSQRLPGVLLTPEAAQALAACDFIVDSGVRDAGAEALRQRAAVSGLPVFRVAGGVEKDGITLSELLAAIDRLPPFSRQASQ